MAFNGNDKVTFVDQPNDETYDIARHHDHKHTDTYSAIIDNEVTE